MTPTARKKHVAAMKQICIDHGFEEDAYGNFLLPHKKDFRIKFKTVNVRFERKESFGRGWVSANYSVVISKINLKDWEDKVSMKTKVFSVCGNSKDKPKPAPAGVSFFGPHMEYPKVIARFNKLSEERHEIDYQCYLKLKEVFDCNVLSVASIFDDLDRKAELKEDVENLINNRREVSDKLTRLLATGKED